MSRLDEAQGRADFFRACGRLLGGFLAERAEEAVLALNPGRIRPPGAQEELAFLAACTRCGACIAACPHEALRPAGGEARLGVGTPFLEPRVMPCFLCEALPCVRACPSGALAWPGPAGARDVRMGRARLRPERCLTWPGRDREASSCRACEARCPWPGEALRMVGDPRGGPSHPEVVEAACTGCGLCVFACVAEGSAIDVQPG